MNFFIRVWDGLKQPKIWALVIFYIFFAITLAGTLTLLILNKNQGVWHYILYGVSAIELSYFVYTIIHFAPKIKTFIVKKLRKYRITREILDNYGYKTMLFSVFH